MISHAFKPDPHGRDVCDQKSDEDGRVEFCGQRRSEHMDETHALRVQLATALKERDEAKACAADVQSANLGLAHRMEEYSAEVKRLRDLCRDVQGWMDEKHATARFDGLAEKFRKATGRFPPGKSRPMEMGVESEQEQEDNRERWRAFNQKALADVCDRIRAALATGGDRG